MYSVGQLSTDEGIIIGISDEWAVSAELGIRQKFAPHWELQ